MRYENGNDNSAAIFISAPGGHRQHLVVMSNSFDSMGPGGGNGGAGYDSYGNDYALFENNEARNCTSDYCLWLKGGHRYTTVRGERATEGNVPGTVLLNVSLGQDGGTEISEQVEVSYCAVSADTGHAMRFHWATTADQNGPVWIYRCTVAGGAQDRHFDRDPGTLPPHRQRSADWNGDHLHRRGDDQRCGCRRRSHPRRRCSCFLLGNPRPRDRLTPRLRAKTCPRAGGRR